MKRFVTYLYECKRGNKTKNIGFIRVNIRGDETKMEIYVRNYIHGTDEGKLYAIVGGDVLQGMELGRLEIMNGQSDTCLAFHTENIVDSGFSVNDITGIGIRLDSGIYAASCWKDEQEDEIVRGEFLQLKREEDERTLPFVVATEQKGVEETCPFETELKKNTSVVYEKIDLSQIRDLSSPNWHFATNSFLVHGFWNYGYLVLKKEVEEGKETLSLGVPGIFEKPEAVMAVLFGFPSFEKLPQEVVGVVMNQPSNIMQKEKNQESEAGGFGCWFVTLKM